LAKAKGAAGLSGVKGSRCVCEGPVCEWKVQWNNAHTHTKTHTCSRNMTENYLEEIL